MARGILDSLMSATYFNASALRLLRQLVNSYFVPQVQLLLDCMSLDERTQLLFSLFLLQVTGGANFDLEMSLAEGAGLRGGYSTHHSLAARSPSPASPSPLFHQGIECGWNRLSWRVRPGHVLQNKEQCEFFGETLLSKLITARDSLRMSDCNEFSVLERFGDLFSAAIRENGTLCLSISRQRFLYFPFSDRHGSAWCMMYIEVYIDDVISLLQTRICIDFWFSLCKRLLDEEPAAETEQEVF